LAEEGQVNFTPTDMKMMQAIAYGPLLQEMWSVQKGIKVYTDFHQL